jgi:hypothetical protein
MGAFFQTVSGRRDCGFGHEHNDCTVRALARAGQITYAQAHAIAEAAGRKNAAGSASKRSSSRPEAPAHRKLSFRRRMRVSTFARRYPPARCGGR